MNLVGRAVRIAILAECMRSRAPPPAHLLLETERQLSLASAVAQGRQRAAVAARIARTNARRR